MKPDSLSKRRKIASHSDWLISIFLPVVCVMKFTDHDFLLLFSNREFNGELKQTPRRRKRERHLKM